MVKPKSREPDAPTDEIDDAYSPPDLDFYAKREELLGESSNGSIRVYREGPGGYRDLTFVRSFSLNEFQPEMLQAPPFNGGRFRIHMLGSGQSPMRANFLFKVEPLHGAKPLDAPGGIATVPSAADTGAILTAIKESVLAGFTALAQSIQPQQHGLGVEEAIKLITALQALQPAPRPDSGGIGALKQLSEVIAVVEDLRGPVDGDGKVSMLGVISRALDKIAEPLGDVISTVAKRKLAANPAALAALGSPAGDPPVNLLDQLKSFLPMLIAQADANNDPATYAEMLLDNAPADAVRPWIARPDWFDELVKLDSRVTPYRAWFTELHAAVAEGLTGELEASTTPIESQNATTGDALTGGKSEH